MKPVCAERGPDQDPRAPVSRKLLRNGGYNELLHSLVRLGHQVDRRAFLHDADVFLESLTDHLAGSTAVSTCFNGPSHLMCPLETDSGFLATMSQTRVTALSLFSQVTYPHSHFLLTFGYS